MAKFTINDITSGYASTTALNTAFNAIESEFQNKVLYRNNPSGEPNTMENDLDFNSNDILNVGTANVTSIVVNGIDLTAQVAAAQASATAAATSESNAATSESNAAASAAAAAAYVDTFDDLYLGAKATNPSVDNDGDPLQDGALYFDTTNDVMKVYDLGTTTWYQLTPSAANQVNINTVAGIATDVSAVAAIDSDVTTVAGVDTEVSTVSGISANVTTVAGISGNVTTVANNDANITTVAGIDSDVTSVAGIASDVTTVATNVTDVTTFATTYLGAQASAPTTSVTGALYYNTSVNQLYVWDGSAWQEAAFSAAGAVTSFNTRTGAVTLTSGDVTTALTYTPLDAAGVSVYGATLIDDADAATARTTLGLGSAATTDSTAYVGKTSATGSGELPSGTTAERDGSPSAGYIRFNSDETSFEGYDGSAWGSIGGGASAGGAIYENVDDITSNYTLTTGSNGMSVGPITIASGVTVTVPSGQRWVIL